MSPEGLLQPLPMPNLIWEDISMDFIDGLLASKGKTTILVVVDRLSKYAHFTAISHPYTAVSVAQTFFDQIFRLHGMPRSIVCDRDSAFISIFWQELFRLNGTKFNFNSAYHPRTDCQSEVSKWLSWAEYCYNTSWYSTIKKEPFEAVSGRAPPTL
ncbi:hypothetical protein AMTRI_Chr04g181630 [Amborella trichopoda]